MLDLLGERECSVTELTAPFHGMAIEDISGHPEARVASPETLGGTGVLLALYVDDVDAGYDRAVQAGATATMPPADTFFGDRYSWLSDPFGHIWALATVKETVTPNELASRMQDYVRASE